MAKKYLSSTGLTHLWEKIKSVFAPLVSPTFTGIPIAPTAATTTNSTQIATTQYVQNNMANCYTQTDADTALAKKVNIDGTTPMAYLDVGDRKAGSTVGKYSVVEGGDKAYVTDTSTGATSDMSNIASGYSSHAEGMLTTASEIGSHAEGENTTASGQGSHAEGIQTTASRDGSHAEGLQTTSSGQCSHSEGCSAVASGMASHAGGFYTIASGENQTAIGTYNVEDSTGANLLIVGNGTSDTARSNAFTVGTDGSATVSTKLNCSGIADNDSKRLISVNDIQEMLYKRVRTIAVADWTNKSATISISLPESMLLEQAGMSTFITAAPASCSDYAKFGVYCSAESGTTLTFTCSKVPTVDLNVNILVEYCCPQV